MYPGTDVTEETASMFTQLTAHLRFGSALRTLALALLLSGAIAPTAFADHMGNHIRGGGDGQSTDTTSVACGSEIADSSSDGLALHFMAKPAGGSGTDAQDDAVPTHPFSRPW
jgi:hypothetical protein